MKEAEELAFNPRIADLSSSAKGQYSIGTVYEEWGRSLGLLGQTDDAIEYLDKAHKALTEGSSQNRDILMKTAKAIVFVHGGEIQQGVQVAVESVDLCRKHGNMRLMERIYGVQQYLDRLSREIGNARSELREALAGPIEH
ncbi:MAG: hypothetical protein PVS3B3_25010 [Ktedonobacteraceae bacterium]